MHAPLFTFSDAPHWMNSIHQLTESDGPVHNSRLPFAQRFQMGPSSGWPQQMQNPPPGFRNAMRPNNGPTEAHKMAEGGSNCSADGVQNNVKRRDGKEEPSTFNEFCFDRTAKYTAVESV